MNIEFAGKTVIVTGGAHGFGRAIAHAFAARGAHTWTCDILAEGLAETAAQAAPAAGGRLETARVDVNNVAPGFVRSNPATERQWDAYGAEGQRRLIERIALRRLGSPADIAHAVLFFASDQASWITGQVLSVSGGA